MVVTMLAVRMVEVTFDQIVDVISMGNGLMATVRTVLMRCLVGAAVMFRSAIRRVGGAHFQHMLVHMVPMRMVQMPVVEVVFMPFVLDGGMATTGAMLMGMRSVLLTIAHLDLLGPAARL